jgi:hypothetical protein
MKWLNSAIVSVGVVVTCVSQTFAAPLSGAFATDPQNEYVQDLVLERISTVNMIMCFMGNLRPDAKVNAGTYLALVDQSLCGEKGGSDTGGSGGASAAVNYAKATVQSTRTSNSDPMVVKAWVKPSGNELIFTYTTVTAGVSSTNPNGIFTMNFCGVSAASNTPLTDPCLFSGTLTSAGSTVTFYESGTMGSPYSNALTLSQTDSTSGSGRLAGSQGGSFDQVFAYNSTHFYRGNANNTQLVCFDRDGANANYSTWRYGMYNDSGTRYELANPGFPVTYEVGGITYYGYAGFWGIYLPNDVLSSLTTGSTLVRRDPASNSSTNYTVTKAGGKLYRLSKQAATLGASQGQAMRVFMSGGETEIQWDGTNLTILRTFSGGSWSECTASCTLSASTLYGGGTKTLFGYAESLGGEIAIAVPSSGGFTSDTVLTYRTRDVVAPSNQPVSLKCISRCPKGGLSNSDFSGGSPYETGATDNNLGTPIAKANAISYSFSSGMMINGNGTAGNVDASALSLSGQYQYGFHSGRLIAPSDTTSYGQASCDGSGNADPSGTNLCPWLVDVADVVYQWETGPNGWNQYVGLSTGGSTVAFDPPTMIPFSPSLVNTTGLTMGNTLLGSTIQLQYGGFGELQGIPGSCVNPSTNETVNCGTSLSGGLQVRYVPAFSITDGTSATVSGSTKWIKYLDREIRLSEVAQSNCSSLTLPTAATLPSSATDPRPSTGAEPSLSTSIPAVIHGVVQ